MARESDFNLAAALATPSFTPGKADAPALVELILGGDDRAAAALATLPVAREAMVARGSGGPTRPGARGSSVRSGSRRAPAISKRAMRCSPSSPIRARACAARDRRRRQARRWRGDRRARAALGCRRPPPGAARARRCARQARRRCGARAPPRARSRRRQGARAPARSGRAGRRSRRDAATDASEVAMDLAARRAARRAPRLSRRHRHAPRRRLPRARLRRRPHARRSRRRGHARRPPVVGAPRIRLWATAGIRVPLVAPHHPHAPARAADPRTWRAPSGDAALVAAIATTILGQRAFLAAWTRGAIRWRLGFADGHRRAVVWSVAREVTHAAPELLITTDADHVGHPRRRSPTPTRARADPAPRAGSAVRLARRRRAGGVAPDDRRGARARRRRAPHRHGVGSVLRLRGRSSSSVRSSARTARSTAPISIRARSTPHARTSAPRTSRSPPPSPTRAPRPPRRPSISSSRTRRSAAACTSMPPRCSSTACRTSPKRLGRGGRLVWITPAAKHTTPAAERAGLVRAVALRRRSRWRPRSARALGVRLAACERSCATSRP